MTQSDWHRHLQVREARKNRVGVLLRKRNKSKLQFHQQMRDAFFTDSDAWKGQVISQARQAMFQAVDGLTG